MKISGERESRYPGAQARSEAQARPQAGTQPEAGVQPGAPRTGKAVNADLVPAGKTPVKFHGAGPFAESPVGGAAAVKAPVFSGAKAENTGVQAGHGRETASLRDLAALLKLPAGTLSESLISFFRYFSLPLEPKNLAVLRREVLGQKHREAAALAAASAAAKGLALESRALTGYAAAIEGIEGGGRDNGGGAHDQTAGGGGNPHDGAAGNGTNGRRRDETGGTKPDVGKITPGEIRQGITEILEREPLLDFINRIPGKRGRWVVLPFSCSDNGIELAVSFRILIDMVSKFAADIKVSGPGAARRWFFLLDGITGDGNFSGCRAELSAAPPLTGKSESDLAAACAGLFGMAQDRVTVKDGVPPCADARPDPLSSVDEEI